MTSSSDSDSSINTQMTSTTETSSSNIPSSSDDAFFPFFAMLAAIFIGAITLKIKDFRR
jgi:hypothetical protein